MKERKERIKFYLLLLLFLSLGLPPCRSEVIERIEDCDINEEYLVNSPRCIPTYFQNVDNRYVDGVFTWAYVST